MPRSKIIEGLKDAVRHARGDKSKAETHIVYVDDPASAWKVVEDAPGRPLPFVIEHGPTGQVFTVKRNRNKVLLTPRRWGSRSVAQAFADDLNRKTYGQ